MRILTGTLDFEEIDYLGKGHYGAVNKVRDTQLDRIIALKKIPKSGFKGNVAAYFDEAQRLNDVRHPNIVDILHASQSGDEVLLGMEYCGGGTFGHLINSRYLTAKEIVQYGLGFLSGLHHVHVKKLVHFDVRPKNILIDGFGRAKLADFGLARHIDGFGITKRGNMYTRQIPPEAFVSTLATQKFDIFQAGFTLYRACNTDRTIEKQHQDIIRQGIFGNIINSIIKGEFPDRERYLPHIPRKMRRIINRAMSVDPDKRYDSILELMNALAALDDCLEWVCERGPAGGYVWTLEADTHQKQVAMEYDGNSALWNVRCYKLMASGNATNRPSWGKGDRMDSREALAYIEPILAKGQDLT